MSGVVENSTNLNLFRFSVIDNFSSVSIYPSPLPSPNAAIGSSPASILPSPASATHSSRQQRTAVADDNDSLDDSSLSSPPMIAHHSAPLVLDHEQHASVQSIDEIDVDAPLDAMPLDSSLLSPSRLTRAPFARAGKKRVREPVSDALPPVDDLDNGAPLDDDEAPNDDAVVVDYDEPMASVLKRAHEQFGLSAVPRRIPCRDLERQVLEKTLGTSVKTGRGSVLCT